MTNEEFKNELEKLGIKLTSDQQTKLENYYQLLIKENENINLTRITDKQEVYLKHFYDSLTIAKIINLNDFHSLCDVGTGAGFPGIVLRIIYPNIHITLVDSLKKRISFLNNVIKALKLSNIEAIPARIEEYSKENEEKFDIVTSRAVAKTNILLELTARLIKKQGYLILLKSEVQEELANSQNAQQKLQIKLKQQETFYLPKENSLRTILKFQKLAKTDLKYPREFSKIKKSPL